jgi:hypothetical protein
MRMVRLTGFSASMGAVEWHAHRYRYRRFPAETPLLLVSVNFYITAPMTPQNRLMVRSALHP